MHGRGMLESLKNFLNEETRTSTAFINGMAILTDYAILLAVLKYLLG